VKRGPIRVLELAGDPASRGTIHGSAFAAEIGRYADERLGLAANGSWSGRPVTSDDVLALAEEMLPHHRRYAPDLYEEMMAMAESASISPAEAVVVGGFTDFVDAVRARGATDVPEEDDCTAVIVPDADAEGAGFLAQTWDMHDTATEHVVMLRIQPDDGPEALVFSTVGCLGQIGMNSAGIAIGINNLAAADGGVAVTWPFLVRKVLQQRNIDAALEAVMTAPLAGGHNYLLFDGAGHGYNVEAMPTRRSIEQLDGVPLVHTNHVLDASTRAVEAHRPADLMESSEQRLAKAEEILQERPITLDLLIALTREPDAICRRSEPPYNNESSGAVIMRPATSELWACWGVPADNEFEHLTL
jgi:isopenicillin-N N-acyltransferase-like protein